MFLAESEVRLSATGVGQLFLIVVPIHQGSWATSFLILKCVLFLHVTRSAASLQLILRSSFNFAEMSEAFWVDVSPGCIVVYTDLISSLINVYIVPNPYCINVWNATSRSFVWLSTMFNASGSTVLMSASWGAQAEILDWKAALEHLLCSLNSGQM